LFVFLPNFAFHENDNEAYKAHEETFQTQGRLERRFVRIKILKGLPTQEGLFIFNNFKKQTQQ